jgi:hypothetical protein
MNNPKFKVGDIVRIRKPQLSDNGAITCYLNDITTINEKGQQTWFSEDMDQYDGCTGTIKNADNRDAYQIKDYLWCYHEDWLILVSQQEKETKETTEEDNYRTTEDGFKTNDDNWKPGKWLI